MRTSRRRSRTTMETDLIPMKPADRISFLLHLRCLFTWNDKPSFIRGSRANTLSLVYEGFRYTKDGKTAVNGRQAWRCVRKNDKYPDRVYTLGDSTVGTPRPHCSTAIPPTSLGQSPSSATSTGQRPRRTLPLQLLHPWRTSNWTPPSSSPSRVTLCSCTITRMRKRGSSS